MKRSSFLNYLFKERKKIIEWNKKHNLLSFAFFALKIRLISNFKQILDELFLRYVFPVSPYLTEIITNGWQWQILTIKEYNFIIYFEDFCSKMSAIEKDRSLSEKKYFIMEESFLKLIYNEPYIELLEKGLEKILLYYKKMFYKNEDIIHSLIKNLSNFFTQKAFNPSFYDLILAFNIAHFKKYFELDDIMHHHFKEIVETRFFNCTKDVFVSIITFIKATMIELEKLEAERSYIEWLTTMCTVRSNETPFKIIAYYESLGHNWQNDINDVFLLLILLTEGIVQDLDTIINKEWQIMTDEEKIIHKAIVPDKEAEIVYKEIDNEFQHAKLRHTAMLPPQMSIHTYLQAENPEDVIFDRNQMYIYERIENIFSGIRMTAHTFNAIYEERFEKHKKTLQFMIANPVRWRGKPVFAVFRYYTELFLQICGFFREKKLLLEIKKYPGLLQKIKNCKEKIKWTSDSNSFIIEAIKADIGRKEAHNE